MSNEKATQSIQTMSRAEVLSELHHQNPFAGYNRPASWKKVSTDSLRSSLARYRGEFPARQEKAT
jgi:hypothetical protein